MKKLLSLSLLLLVSVATMAEGMPTLSTDENTHWYYLKFTQGAYVVGANGDGQCCKAVFPTEQKTQLWKVEAASAGGYTFTNQLGQQLYVSATSSGGEVRASTTPTTQNRFRITAKGANFTISPYANTGQAFNCWGGMGYNNDIKLYATSDANAAMDFLSESDVWASNPEVDVIPYPKEFALTDCGPVDLSRVKVITCFSDSTRLLAQRFADDLKRVAGIDIPVQQLAEGESVEGSMEAPVISLNYSESTPQDAYGINSCYAGVDITAGSYGGFFYALQTVRQLLPRAIYGQEPSPGGGWTLDSFVMYDEPNLSHRGFHFDVSRHFFTKEEVMKLIDMASIYKLNRFHWHLTDDQGWRIEIPEYPKLTTIGAVRSRSLTINDPTNSAEFYDDTEYGRGCYYTLDDLREVVAYAKERNIEIIPEVDMPGHMVAAIAAYPELSCDPTKTYEVRVAKGISSDVLNVGSDAVIDFLKCVLGHVAEVFPYDVIHIGGDECPTTVWVNNADCKRRIQEEGLSGVEELQPWLVEKLGSWLRDEYGKQVLVWDELLAHWDSRYTVKPIIMAWRGLDYTKQAADKGFQSIAVPSRPLYFDLLQVSPSSMEIDAPYFGGYGDGVVNSVDKVYDFNPTANVSGREKMVLGTQANLWTESLTTIKEAEYQYYPRLIALSETAWMPNSEKNFESFYKRLQTHAALLEAKDINYAKHYFDKPTLPPALLALAEVQDILAKSTPGAVGYPDKSYFTALTTAANKLQADPDDDALLEALDEALAAFKTAPLVMPEEGKTYRIISASTYYRNRYDGSALYADGANLRIHYTEQTEPEELWSFTRNADGSYRLRSQLNKNEVKMELKSNTAATFDATGTDFFLRKPTKAAGGVTYVPGVFNFRSGRFVLFSQMSGVAVANVDSALCHAGTWRIIEVTDFTQRLQGLADKAEHILETAQPGKANEPTEEALAYLRTEVLEAAKTALASAPVSRETYEAIADKYETFVMMDRMSVLDALDENYYYYINNAYFDTYFACGNATTKQVNPLSFGDGDGYKWIVEKKLDGTILLKNKLTQTYAYVNSSAAEERIRLGKEYKWTLREVTTDTGVTALAIIDSSGTYSWYTNPNAWAYVLLKPYDWGASVWKLQKSEEQVETGIGQVISTDADAQVFDLQGRPASEPLHGVYIKNSEKLLR